MDVAAISDDIAYDCHDLEDGLRAGRGLPMEQVVAEAIAASGAEGVSVAPPAGAAR